MTNNQARMIREEKTVEAMIGIYCRGQHDARQALCKECKTLLDYARQRLEMCPFHEGKTTCARCPIHCYSKSHDTTEQVAHSPGDVDGFPR